MIIMEIMTKLNTGGIYLEHLITSLGKKEGLEKKRRDFRTFMLMNEVNNIQGCH